MPTIELYNETGNTIPLTSSEFEQLTQKVADGENVQFGLIEIVYVDEAQIIEINRNHLNHDYVTDIITFSYTDEDESPAFIDNTDIEGTLYMCEPRISEQAEDLNTAKKEEFARVFVHGLLHLCGFDDRTPELKQIMTQKENQYLIS